MVDPQIRMSSAISTVSSGVQKGLPLLTPSSAELLFIGLEPIFQQISSQKWIKQSDKLGDYC